MANWLDKYEQGGLVLKQKTKDNYGTKPNVNDVKVSAGPNFVGEGYTAYNWKSPAWGGQFAMGGSLPGSVGFMYARTINPAPANGKYTKKTLASAQFGMELMPYMAQAAVSVKNALPSIEDIKNKAVDKTKEVIKNSPTARKLINKTISAIANSDWGKEKLQNFARNIHPRGYSSVDQPFERIYSTAIKNKKESYREELDKELATPGKAFSSDSVRVDLLNRYAGLPEKYNTLKPSLYIPSGGNKNEKYFSSPQIEREILEELNTISNGVFQKKGFKTKKELEELIAKTSSHVEDPKRPGEYVPIKGKGNNYVAPIPGLGQGTYGIGEDEKGHYLSYYDLWDLNPYYGEYATASNSMDKLGQEVLGNEKEDVATKHIGNPTKMYGRIYFDKKTGKPKMQNGGEMAFYQNGLDFKPKSISKKGKKIIKDDMGQWAHPGEITEISSPDITMQGVDYPVLGISDTGDTKMMYPDQDYKFDGKKVTEYPMAQNGWLSKYTPEPMRQDATRNIQFEQSVKNTVDQYRRAIDPENQPHISKWTPKPGEIKRLEEQDRQRREENSGFLNRLAANPHVAKLQNNVLIPMFDLYTVGEGAVAAKAIAKPALKQAGKYLTEKATLKSATANASPSNYFSDLITSGKSYLEEKAGERLAGAKNRAAIAEGNKWSQDWISNPETAKKIRQQIIDQKIFGNQNPAIFDRINTPETSQAYHYLTNYKPGATEFPLADQKKDLINTIMGKNMYSTSMVHGDNLGVSYRHGQNPLLDMDIYIPGVRSSGPGTWISRTPQMNQAARKSVTIHENTHDWLRDDALERLGYKDEIQSHLSQDAMDASTKWIESGYNTKKHYTGYLADPTEVHARIMEVRNHFGLTPTDKVTPELAESMLEVIRKGKVPTVDKRFADIFSSPKGVAQLFNKLPALAPVAVGVGAAATTLPKKQKDGGWLNKYK